MEQMPQEETFGIGLPGFKFEYTTHKLGKNRKEFTVVFKTTRNAGSRTMVLKEQED